jgi:hypothetical protein
MEFYTNYYSQLIDYVVTGRVRVRALDEIRRARFAVLPCLFVC